MKKIIKNSWSKFMRFAKVKGEAYLPDIFILLVIWTFAYVTYFEFPFTYNPFTDNSFELGYDYRNEVKFLSIIVISLGLDIAIRRWFNK